MRLPPSVAIFGTFTDIKPTFRVYGDLAVWGGTIGGYIQTPHIFGAELRGSLLRFGGLQHQEALLIGPRAAIRFGRFTPYTAVLGGGANSWIMQRPGDRATGYIEKVSPDLSVVAGMDFHMAHHISLRLGEGQYSRLQRSDRPINTVGVSAGIIYRIPF